MPDKNVPTEEAKWWIDRGPARERHKKEQLEKGIVEQWARELLRDYNQDQAVRNVVNINERLLKEFTMAPGEWGYLSLGVGTFPEKELARIKGALKLPPYARALLIDAGYSVRILITGEPLGERLVDVQLTERPSLDYWVNGELSAERLYGSVEEALRKIRASLDGYLRPPAPP